MRTLFARVNRGGRTRPLEDAVFRSGCDDGAMARRATAALALSAVLPGCGGGGHHPRTAPAPAQPRPAAAQPTPTLRAQHACPNLRTARCATLTVPLDHSGRVPGHLKLKVAIAGHASRVLVFLTGGPGQPGAPFLPRIMRKLRAPLRGYRVVMFDQRGTGGGALRCPALQRQVGTSDLTLPSESAVRACAAAIGPKRRFFSTADTVADLEDLRSALGASQIAIDGVSYGTFVAERYALAHPDQVSRLVLDSVVLHSGYSPFDPTPMRAAARVLRLVCAEQRCRTDPVADLAAVVQRYHDGLPLLDTMTALSIGVPRLDRLPAELHEARNGNPRRLDRLVAAVHRAEGAPAGILSQGLHASTVCADVPAPWGGPATPISARPAALASALTRLRPEDIYPFDPATVARNGVVRTCVEWPPMAEPPPPTSRTLPPVPVLLLAGDHDLSTPLEWARKEASLAPQGKLVVVPGAGHGVQSRAKDPRARVALASFLR